MGRFSKITIIHTSDQFIIWLCTLYYEFIIHIFNQCQRSQPHNKQLFGVALFSFSDEYIFCILAFSCRHATWSPLLSIQRLSLSAFWTQAMTCRGNIERKISARASFVSLCSRLNKKKLECKVFELCGAIKIPFPYRTNLLYVSHVQSSVSFESTRNTYVLYVYLQ